MGHPADACCVFGAECLVAVAGGGEPAEGAGVGFRGGLVVELGVQLGRVDRELEVPGGEQDGGGDEAEDERDEREPRPYGQAGAAQGGRAEERGDEGVGGEQGAGALADAGDELSWSSSAARPAS